jgi:hypothetical protein
MFHSRVPSQPHLNVLKIRFLLIPFKLLRPLISFLLPAVIAEQPTLNGRVETLVSLFTHSSPIYLPLDALDGCLEWKVLFIHLSADLKWLILQVNRIGKSRYFDGLQRVIPVLKAAELIQTSRVISRNV